MDLIDLWWNASQQTAIRELQSHLASSRRNQNATLGHHTRLIELLQEENDELRLRLGVLIRLLIQQGALSADAYGAALNETKINLAIAQNQAQVRQAKKPRPKPPAKLRKPEIK